MPANTLAGVLIGLFTIEQGWVNGITKGFDHPEPPPEDGSRFRR